MVAIRSPQRARVLLADQQARVEGTDARVAAAEHLKTELTNILAGEPSYDIFVRRKPLTEQSVGWEPDINDGMQMNIRPRMTARPLGAGANGGRILRLDGRRSSGTRIAAKSRSVRATTSLGSGAGMNRPPISPAARPSTGPALHASLQGSRARDEER